MAEQKYTIGIEVKADGAVKVFDKVKEKVAETGEQAHKSSRQVDGFESSFSKLGASLVSMNQGLDLASRMFSVASGATRVFVNFLNDASVRADDMGDLAAKIGVTARFLSELEIAAKTSGTTIETLGSGIKSLARSATAANAGNEKMRALFVALGVDTKQASTNFEGFFESFARGFGELPAGPERTAVALKLMRGAGAELLPLMDEITSKGLPALRREAEATGIVLDTSFVAASDRLQDALIKLGMVSVGVQEQLAIGFVPVLAKMGERLFAMVQKFDLSNGALTSLGEAFGTLLEGPMTRVIEYLDNALTAAKGDLAEGLRVLLVDGFALALEGGVVVASAVGSAIGDAFAYALTTQGKKGLAFLLNPVMWVSDTTAPAKIDYKAIVEKAMPAPPAEAQMSLETADMSLETHAARLTQVQAALLDALDGEKKLAKTVADSATAYQTKISALDSDIARLTITSDLMNTAIAQGKSYEETQRLIANALLVSEAAQMRANGATAAQANEWLEASQQVVALNAEIDKTEDQFKKVEESSKKAATGASGAFENIADNFVSAIEDSFDAVINGTRSLGDVWSGMMLSLTKQFLGDTVAGIGKYFSSGGSSKALLEIPSIKAIDESVSALGKTTDSADKSSKALKDATDTQKSSMADMAAAYAQVAMMGAMMGEIVSLLFQSAVRPFDPEAGQYKSEKLQNQMNANAKMGGMLGGAGGAVAGAVIGTMILPGIGTIIGAAIGAIVGAAMGAFAGKAATAFGTLGGQLKQGMLEQNFKKDTALGKLSEGVGFKPRVENWYQSPQERGAYLSPEVAEMVQAFAFMLGGQAGDWNDPDGNGDLLAKTDDLGISMFNLIGSFISNVGLGSKADAKEAKALLSQQFKDMGIGAKTFAESASNLLRSVNSAGRGGTVIGSENRLASVINISSDLISADMPEGVNMEAILLGSLGRFTPADFAYESNYDGPTGWRDPANDGARAQGTYGEIGQDSAEGVWENSFDNLTQQEKEFFLAITKDADTFQEVLVRAAEAGLTVNLEKFLHDLEMAQASAMVVGAALPAALFQSENIQEGFATIMGSLGDTVKEKVGAAFTSSLLDETMIGHVFAPVFEVLDKIDEVDFTSAGGADAFMSTLLPAIAAGEKNLEEYLPILKEMIKKAKEIDAAIDEAIDPGGMIAFGEAFDVATQGFADRIVQIVSDGILSGLQEGLTPEAMKEAIGKNLEAEIAKTIVKGIVMGIVLSSGLAAEAQAFGAALFKAIFNDGVIGPNEQIYLDAMWSGLMKRYGMVVDLVGDLPGIGDLFEDPKTEVEIRIETSTENIAGTLSETLSGAIKEGMQNGLTGEALKEFVYDKLNLAVMQAVFDGMMAGLMEAAGMEQYIKEWSSAIAKATADGKITADEQLVLDAWKNGAQVRVDKIVDQAEKSGLYDLLPTQEETDEAITPVREGYKELDKTACGAECAAEKRLAVVSAKGTFLSGLGRYGAVDVEAYLPTAEAPPAADRQPWYKERDLPHYADGGIAWRRQIAVVGEAGPELIVPLSRTSSANGLTAALDALAKAIELQPTHVEVKLDQQVLIDAIANAERLGRRSRRSMGSGR